MVRSMPDLGGEPLYAGHSTPIFVPRYLRPLSAPWTGRQASLIHPLLLATEMCSGSSSQMHQSEHPTVVVETGYSQPYSQLRIAARDYLRAGTIDGMLSMDRDGRPVARIELVILLVYVGRRPTLQEGQVPFQGENRKVTVGAYDPEDYCDNGQLKTMTIRVEFWRLRPTMSPSERVTRSCGKNGAVKWTPTLCDEAVVYPITEKQLLTVWATDLIGSESMAVEDPLRQLYWEVDAQAVFGKAAEHAVRRGQAAAYH